MNHGLLMRCSRKRGHRFTPSIPRGILRDFALENRIWEGETMFEGMTIGAIVMIETLSFPYVGRVAEVTDSRVILADSVKVLWDGRHGQYAGGKVPASAEIEQTFPLLRINADAVIAWADWQGKTIPKSQ